ncbi:MAG: flavodoxin family protein [Lachnospirales bacterium]
MSKKVIIISASPRKNGNSDILCDKFMEGALASGNSVEKFFLNNKKVNYCVGCGYCFNNVGQCSQKDDMVLLFEKLIDADVIVLATPIYFYTMNGQMKTFIDRLCPIYTKLENKEFYYIMTSADKDKNIMDRCINEFRGLTFCLKNPVEKGIIYGTGIWNVGDVEKTEFMKDAFVMGKNI